MTTILKPCQVPWKVSPSISGIKLNHIESGSDPECKVEFQGMGQRAEGGGPPRQIDIMFEKCFHVRMAPHFGEDSIEAIGYQVMRAYEGEELDYLDWLNETWRETGLCPSPGFYVATKSDWLDSIRSCIRDCFQEDTRHYVIDGVASYVEFIAEKFSWQEWELKEFPIGRPATIGALVGAGEGVE